MLKISIYASWLFLGVPLVASGKEAEALIGQWMKTEDLIAKEAAEWQQKKAHLTRLMQVYGEELSLLEEELEKSGGNAKQVDEAKITMKASVEASENVRKQTIAFLSRVQPRMKALSDRFPLPLRQQLKPELDYIAVKVDNKNVREVLRSMVKVLQDGEKFSRSFTFEQQLIKLGGESLRADVMYLGFSCVFFKAGSRVGIGRPSTNGWVFEEKPEIREQLEKGFAIKNKQAPSALFQLPIQRKEDQP